MAAEDVDKFDEILAKFDEIKILESWRTAYSSSTERLNAVVRKHLANYVPAIFRGSGYPAVSTEEEERANRYIFEPLERFLCNDTDPDAVYQRLRQRDAPPALCGRVFRLGEPTYSCKDCGMDHTCVMCVSCFENSAHKKHRYRMSTSGGGGYCDCGDREAWKSDPVCQLHCRGGAATGVSLVSSPVTTSLNPAMTGFDEITVNAVATDSSAASFNPAQTSTDPVMTSSDTSQDYSALENLPDEFRQRACSLFEVLMRYALEMLLWNKTLSLPANLEPDPFGPTSSFCTVLYNDETHTYDQVIKALVKALDCEQTTAVDFATAVDREGRQIVKMGRHDECDQVRKTIKQQTSRNNQTALKVLLYNTAVASHQRFAVRVFLWLHDVIRQSEGLRQLFAALVLDDSYITVRHRDIMVSLKQQADNRSSSSSVISIASSISTGGTPSAKPVTPLTPSPSSSKKCSTGASVDLMLRPRFMGKPSSSKAVVKHAVDANTVAKTPSFMETLMLTDAQLWKSARVQSRQLMMAAVLMDGTSKRRFAALFTRHYQELTSQFVADDHDHSVSVTSESVQLYTVPSIARWLVAEHNALAVILKTFRDLTKIFTGGDGTLKRYSFERMEKNGVFRRVVYTLVDLKYILLSPPVHHSEWSDNLRARFLEGFDVLLDILSCMQGMDSIVRQTGQHVEYEPEWEGAFNLQIRLSDSLAILLDWCRSDHTVLLEAYDATASAAAAVTSPEVEASIAAETARNMVRRETVLAVITGATATVVAAATGPPGGTAFGNNMEAAVSEAAERAAVAASEAVTAAAGNRFESCTVAGITTECIRFDMSSQPVSVHHPVTRLLAGLCTCINKSDISLEQLHSTRWRNIGAASASALALEMMEPSLRAVVLAAQCNAGLWRRNGYALQNQVYFYQSVKCRAQMFDKDVLILQTCASLMDSADTFLIALLHKFGLVKWTRDDYDTDVTQEDSAKQTITLAEHLLKLLIVILCERYVEGVGAVSQVDIVKREIVHQLCIQPMSHSELTKALADDPYKENNVDDVIEEVAVLRQSGEGSLAGGAKRLFELRPEFYSLYTPYFYHYSRSDQVKSEESEKKRRKNANQPSVLSCPDLPEYIGVYRGLTRLLMCDITIHMVKLVLMRSTAKWSKSWSEAQLDMILFLIDLGLNEQKADAKFEYLERITSCGIVTQLELLSDHPNTARAGGPREFIQFLLRKCSSLRNTGGRSGFALESSEDVNMEDDGNESERLEKERAKKTEQANKRRERIMANMAKMQRNFIRENRELFDSTPMEVPALPEPAGTEEEDLETVAEKPVCVGARRSAAVSQTSRQMCILCQEEQEVTCTGRAMVLCAYIQKSTVLSRRRINHRAVLASPAIKDLSAETSERRSQSPAAPSNSVERQRCRTRVASLSYDSTTDMEPPAAKRGTTAQPTSTTAPELSPLAASLFAECDLPIGTFVNTCGHVMHSDCWQRFYAALVTRESRRGLRFRIPPSSFDVSRNEFLCPLCEMVSNTVLPIVPQLSGIVEDIQQAASTEHDDELTLDDWLEGIENTVIQSIKKRRKQEDEEATSMFDESYLFVPCPLSSVTRMMTESVARNFQALFYYVTDEGGMVNVGEGELFSDDMIDMLRKFATDGFATSLGTLPDENDARVPVSVWALCVYTIRAAENYLRLGHCWGGGPVQDGLFKPYVEGALFGALPSRQAECLGALVRLAAVVGTVTAATVVRQHCVAILSSLLSGCKSLVYDSPPITSVDLFHVLVVLCLSLPTLYAEEDSDEKKEEAGIGASPQNAKKDCQGAHHIATGRLNDSHALHLVYTAHLVQCIIGCDVENLVAKETAMVVEEENLLHVEEANRLLPIFLDLRKKAGVPVSEGLSPMVMLQTIRESCRSFLRCAALFFHYLTSVPAPLELFENRDPESGRDEFLTLCQYLGLTPDIPTLLTQSSRCLRHMDAWCEKAANACDAVVYRKRLASFLRGFSEQSGNGRLIALPDDYSELINETSMFACPRSAMGDESRSPAMCLVCGAIVCSQSYCCQMTLEDGVTTIGAATGHARQCGAGTGIFLRVRDCQVLLLNPATSGGSGRITSNRGCFVAPPYLDAYGETDEGLRRGDALRLCTARYERLQRLWLSHGVAEEAVHVLESNSNLLTLDWNQF